MRFHRSSLGGFLGASLALWTWGCGPSPSAPDPQAAKAVRAYWDALAQNHWQEAYEHLHPEVKSILSLSLFRKMQEQRKKTQGFPQSMDVLEQVQIGPDVIVSLGLTFPSLPPGGPAVTSPPRRVIVKKVGESWSLSSPDLLSALP